MEIIEEAYEAEEMESEWESDVGASQDNKIYDAFIAMDDPRTYKDARTCRKPAASSRVSSPWRSGRPRRRRRRRGPAAHPVVKSATGPVMQPVASRLGCLLQHKEAQDDSLHRR